VAAVQDDGYSLGGKVVDPEAELIIPQQIRRIAGRVRKAKAFIQLVHLVKGLAVDDLRPMPSEEENNVIAATNALGQRRENFAQFCARRPFAKQQVNVIGTYRRRRGQPLVERSRIGLGGHQWAWH
jgi:hypothetical protein